MKIFLIGTHGAGKTTTFHLLEEQELFKSFTFVKEYIEESVRRGAKINGDEDEKSVEIIFNAAQDRFLGVKDNFVADRGFIDILAYSLINKVNPPFRMIKQALQELNGAYIFLFQPDVKKLTQEDNKNRWIDAQAQKDVHHQFLELLSTFSINYHKVPVEFSKEEVVQFIISVCDKES